MQTPFWVGSEECRLLVQGRQAHKIQVVFFLLCGQTLTEQILLGTLRQGVEAFFTQNALLVHEDDTVRKRMQSLSLCYG